MRHAFSQGTDSARWRMTARPPQELAALLFDRDTNPRIHPRIFYLGATAVVARLEQWREGPTLTYGALMLNGTVRLGHHKTGWPPPPPAPRRPPCNAQIGPMCVEYAVTPHGVVSSSDNNALPDERGELDWDALEKYNLLGTVIPRQYLLDTSPHSDVFHDPALGAEALAMFDGHVPPILEQAIAEYAATSGQAPAA
jgi:hypothetical protein